jgi:hypothetical protein
MFFAAIEYGICLSNVVPEIFLAEQSCKTARKSANYLHIQDARRFANNVHILCAAPKDRQQAAH